MSDNRWLISLHLPGMENGWALLKDIQNGHRMEKPEYSPNLLGDIMKQCWHINPKERPTFSLLGSNGSQLKYNFTVNVSFSNTLSNMLLHLLLVLN
jgi:hypothetical protein